MNTAHEPSAAPHGKQKRPAPLAWKLLLAAAVASLWLLAIALAGRIYLMYDPQGALELFARLTGQMTHFEIDPVFGWAPTTDLDQDGADPDGGGPHRFKTDENGFRSPSPQPGFQGERLVLLGDSMMWGVGVDQEEITGTVLRKQLGAGSEVIVAASPGWSTDQEYMFFREKVLPFKPSAVVWFVTAVNDIVLNLHSQSSVGVGHHKPRFRIDEEGKLVLVPVDLNAPRPVLGESVEKCSSMLNIFYKRPDARFSEAIRLTARLLSQGRAEWSRDGTKVYFVTFKPNLITNVSTSYVDFAQKFGYNPDDFSEDMAMENIGRLAKEAEIDLHYFDTQPDMMFKTDGHLNPKGHAALARQVQEILAGRAEPRWAFDPARQNPAGQTGAEKGALPADPTEQP